MYDYVISKRPDLKSGIDVYLNSQGHSRHESKHEVGLRYDNRRASVT